MKASLRKEVVQSKFMSTDCSPKLTREVADS